LISHAQRVFALGENQVLELAQKLFEKIKAEELSQGFTFREIMRKRWSGFRSSDDVKEALALLVEYGYLTPVENTEGRKTRKYFFNKTLETQRKCTLDLKKKVPKGAKI
jgi:hypothetical protein